MKHLQKASGCRMYIRGRGSLRLRDPAQEQHLAGQPGSEHLLEDLHVLVEYDGPEAARAGPIARLRDGDVIRLCAERGELSALVDAATWDARDPAPPAPSPWGAGRELFALMRATADDAEHGASAMLAAAGL